MSVHFIFMKDGVKMMRPIHSREEYLALRNGGEQKSILAAVRSGDASKKHLLVQMNYSCLPNDDGTLKGSKRMTTTVAMDIDHVPPEEMQPLRERILAKKDELGLDMLEESARGGGYHLAFARKPELSQEDNLKWASQLLGVAYDSQAKDITRVFFTTTEAELIYLDDRLFEVEEAQCHLERSIVMSSAPSVMSSEVETSHEISPCASLSRDDNNPLSVMSSAPSVMSSGVETSHKFPQEFKGVPYAEIIAEYWRRTGGEPTEGERNNRLHKLAANLRAICDDSEEWLLEIMPRYGLSLQEMKSIIHSACKEPTKGSRAMDEIVDELSFVMSSEVETSHEISPQGRDDNTRLGRDDNTTLGLTGGELCTKRLPQGIKDSIDAVGPALAMPIVTAVCPCIGALATGVKLDVHGQMRGLNLISYIAGDFASGKGSIDPVVDAWMSEIKALDDMYIQQEDEFRRKKNAAKNQKNQPEEPKLPVRYITFNTTVANLAERLANVEGKHAFSFTPEADVVAQKWKSAMSDFSVMLRQSYDGSRFDREARSAEAVNVHIKQLLWNVTMCGTPDALYRVVSNYTDGFQSRIALAQTPDNTYAKLEDKPYVLTSRQTERIQQIAHLLPLMYGEVTLPKLEARGRAWLEKIRLEAMMNDDRVKARERFRTCVTAQRMVCCLMLCRVCEQLIQKHGYVGAETKLKQHPDLWREMLLKTQTPAMLDTYDVIADSLIDNALYFFRDRIERAFSSRNYIGGYERRRQGKNDSIFERLDVDFSFEMALQHSICVNGAGVSRNQVRQMLKNWKKQGLIIQTDSGKYRKNGNTKF